VKALAKLQQIARRRGATLTFVYDPYAAAWSVTWEREVLANVGGIVEVDEERISRGDKDFGCACARVLDDLPFHWSWDE
jgi:hypothetical protein